MLRRVLMMLAGLLVLGALGAGSAVAAPEAPEVSVEQPVHATTAVVHGVLNPLASAPGEAGSYEFLYREGAGCEGGSAAPVPAGLAFGLEHEEVSETLSGLLPNATYSVCLLVRSEAGEEAVGPVVSFTTLAVAPSLDAASAGNLTSSSADLTAQIDPNGADTSYRFEYGTSSSYGASVPVPDGDAGAGRSDVSVSQHVAGLSANTTYHWRLVANSVGGTVTGVDHTFVYSTTGAGLPDGRAYEMVTPPRKNGAQIGLTFNGQLPDIAEDGSRVIMYSIQCFAGSVSCNGARHTDGDPFAFTRTGGGWVTTPLAPPATMFTVNSALRYSADADTALFNVAASSGERFLERQPDGSFADIGPANLGTEELVGRGSGVLQVTADLSHFAYGGQSQLLNNRIEAYEYVGSHNAAPVLVGVSGGKGSTDLISECGTFLGNGEESQFNAMSVDGGTVFFTARACSSGAGANAGVPVPADTLYARIDGSRTVLVSGRSPLGCTGVCLGSPAGAARLDGASEDGSKVFFESAQQLTDDASEGGGSAQEGGCRKNGAECNLYEYDFDRPAGRNLVAVSAGDTSGGGPRVQGVTAMSSDGSHVYFVAQGVLSVVANGEGQLARDGGDNLYVFERDATYPEGHVVFIATLPPSDEGYPIDSWKEFPHGTSPNVTPDGRFLVFESRGVLTADDSSTTGAVQVFRYDAQTGALVRVSVGEGGFNDNGNAGESNANIVAAWRYRGRVGPPRPDPTMSNDGSYVFFESPVGLTPGALNEAPVEGGGLAENVYEWHAGHVYLISDGHDVSGGTNNLGCLSSEGMVCLLGSDGTGANVFFTTADELVGQDTDTQVDVYDARICTASEPCVKAAPPVAACQGEACHGAPGGAPSLPGVGSVAFAGAGNLVPFAPVAAHKKKTIVKKHVKRKGRRRRPERRRTHARGHGAARRGVRQRGGQR
jgi:hypothetical protein